MSRKRLDGKVAIITGAGRGIGKEIAIGFVRNGAKLFIMSRTQSDLARTSEELRRLGRQVSAKVADVSSPSDVAELVDETVSRYGKIDILVNNAAILGPIGFLEENDSEAWMHAIYVNIFGVYLACKNVLPYMKKQRRGKIINISGAGAPSPYPRFSAYSSSKTAVLGLTQTLAAEVRGYGIDVNAIAPGPTNTRLQDEIISAGDSAGDAFARARKIKEKGGVDPIRVAELAVFLASANSDGITGKLFSARWDDWNSLKDKAKLRQFVNSEMYTIKRIDGVFFRPTRRLGS